MIAPATAPRRQCGGAFFRRVMMLDHSCQVQRHSHAERGLDLYETPAIAIAALLRVEKIPHCVWECAAGKGAIARVLRAHSHEVICSDIADYGFSLDFQRDFCEAAIGQGGELHSAGRIKTIVAELELFAQSLARDDQMAPQ